VGANQPRTVDNRCTVYSQSLNRIVFQDVETVLEKVRGIITGYNKSNKSKDKLHDLQKALAPNDEALELFGDVQHRCQKMHSMLRASCVCVYTPPYRWNHVYLMVERFLYLHDKILLLSSENDIVASANKSAMLSAYVITHMTRTHTN
jgi:hypothetical protein